MKERAAAIRNAANWATAAFGLAAHCTVAVKWLQRAKDWSPIRQREEEPALRKLEKKERHSADLEFKLAQTQLQWQQAAANASSLKAQLLASQKKCAAAEAHAKRQQVPILVLVS